MQEERLQDRRMRWGLMRSRIDSWRVREVKVSAGYKMLHVSTKGILVCHTFVGVKLNGVLELAETVKI
jgi:hypothetical protein